MAKLENQLARIERLVARAACGATGVAYRCLHRCESLLALAAGRVRHRSRYGGGEVGNEMDAARRKKTRKETKPVGGGGSGGAGAGSH